MAPADDFEEQVSVPPVVAEVTDLVDDQECRAAVPAPPPCEARGRLLSDVSVQHLDGRRPADGVLFHEGLVADVVGDRGLADAVAAGDHDARGLGHEAEPEHLLDVKVHEVTHGRNS